MRRAVQEQHLRLGLDPLLPSANDHGSKSDCAITDIMALGISFSAEVESQTTGDRQLLVW